MNVDFTEAQRQLRDCLQRRFGPEGDLRSLDATARWHEYAASRLLGLTFDEHLGGLGGGPIETMIVMEEIGRTLIGGAFVPTVVQSGEILRQWTDHAAVARTLVQTASGHAQLAVVADSMGHEPNATTATPRADAWMLRGQARLVAGAAGATQLLVFATPTQGDVPFLAIVGSDAPGVVITPANPGDGHLRANIALHDVAVDRSQTVRAGEQAVDVLRRSWDHATAARCAEAVGAMGAGCDLVREEMRTGQWSGTPQALLQGIRHHVVDMVISLELARSASMAVASACQYGSRTERELAVSQATVQIGLCARALAHTATRVHGAVDGTLATPISQLLDRLMVTLALCGDQRFHLRRLNALAGPGLA